MATQPGGGPSARNIRNSSNNNNSSNREEAFEYSTTRCGDFRHAVRLPVSGLLLRNRTVKAATFEGLWRQPESTAEAGDKPSGPRRPTSFFLSPWEQLVGVSVLHGLAIVVLFTLACVRARAAQTPAQLLFAFAPLSVTVFLGWILMSGDKGNGDVPCETRTSAESTSPLASFHRRVAEGGVAVSTVSYGCVAAEGRTFATQPLVNREAVDGLREVAQAIQTASVGGGDSNSISFARSDSAGTGGTVPCRAILQLTHGGYFADVGVPGVGERGTVAPSVVLNPATFVFPRGADEQDLEDIVNSFARAARIATKDAGFDGVEIHCGHGYLLSQFLSPYTNHRTDKYGGSIANRARLPLRVIRAVREAVGPDKAVFVKTNVEDGFGPVLGSRSASILSRLPLALRVLVQKLSPLGQGLTVDDAAEFVTMVADTNCVDATALSGGFISKTGIWMMRGEVPRLQMIYWAKGWWKKLALAVFGWLVVPRVEFSPLFFLQQARTVRTRLRRPANSRDHPAMFLELVGGVNSIAAMSQALGEEGFDLVGIARAIMHDASFLLKASAHLRPCACRTGRGFVNTSGGKRQTDGGSFTSACTHCNRCIVAMEQPQGARCLLESASDADGFGE